MKATPTDTIEPKDMADALAFDEPDRRAWPFLHEALAQPIDDVVPFVLARISEVARQHAELLDVHLNDTKEIAVLKEAFVLLKAKYGAVLAETESLKAERDVLCVENAAVKAENAALRAENKSLWTAAERDLR